jgi:hypothetical protein
VNCIPADVILRTLASELSPKVDEELQHEISHWAAFYEHRLTQGRKEIVHLEAFVAKFMSIYKTTMLRFVSFSILFPLSPTKFCNGNVVPPLPSAFSRCALSHALPPLPRTPPPPPPPRARCRLPTWETWTTSMTTDLPLVTADHPSTVNNDSCMQFAACIALRSALLSYELEPQLSNITALASPG